MKKLFVIVLLLIIVISPVFVIAKEYNYDNSKNIYLLRAGGVSSGSGGGSSGGGSSTSHAGHYSDTSDSNPISYFFNILLFLFITFISGIILYFKVIRSSINSRKYLKILGKKDVAWKYKNIEQQVIKTYYLVQDSWTKMDMVPSKEYMSKKLYDSFKIKLNFMEMNHKRNVLKAIRLIDIKPVSIYDDEDDSNDSIWFYIKGFMIDYTINTETQEKIEGSEFPIIFVEFWKFTRKGKDKWVLDSIKQKEDAETIIFQ